MNIACSFFINHFNTLRTNRRKQIIEPLASMDDYFISVYIQKASKINYQNKMRPSIKMQNNSTLQSHYMKLSFMSRLSAYQNYYKQMQKQKNKSKSLPPVIPKHSYILKSIDLLEGGCYKNSKLNIDGAIGDYRMSIFRRKDKNQYLRNIKTIFTSSFTESILPKDKNNRDIREHIETIIKKSVNQTLDDPESQLKLARLKKKASMNIQQEGAKKQIKHEKGSYISTLQQEDYLICSYLPEYQRKRWFQLKNSNSVIPVVGENNDGSLTNKKVKRKSLLKLDNKSKHIFAYLSNPLYLQKYK